MFFKTAAKYIWLTKEVSKLNLKKAISFRLNFISMLFGMLFNDLAYFSVYLIYFSIFQTINGWTLQDSILLNGIVTVAFSIIFYFFQGLAEISVLISKSKLDQHFLIPKNILWQIAVSKSDLSATGDFLFGLIFLIYSLQTNLTQYFFALISIINSALLLAAFLIITQSYYFFRPRNLEQSEDALFHSILNFITQPQTIYQNFKLLFQFIFPVFFISYLPTELVKSPSWQTLLTLTTFTTIYFSISILIFNQGLKRYESTNAFTQTT